MSTNASNTITLPSAPLYNKLVPFLPEEGTYDTQTRTYSLDHRLYTLQEWFNKTTIHDAIVTCETILSFSNTITQVTEMNPIFQQQDTSSSPRTQDTIPQDTILVLDTGSILWIPSKFTQMPASQAWVTPLSIFLQQTLLSSQLNTVGANTIRDMLGSIPLTYTLERMTYNMPYAVVV